MMMAAGVLPMAEDEFLLPKEKELNERRRRGGEGENIAGWTEGKNEAESVNPFTRGVGRHSV
jgi:hypothetical protein